MSEELPAELALQQSAATYRHYKDVNTDQMIRNYILSGVLFLAAVPASAADFSVGSGACDLVLSGQIEEGDFQAIQDSSIGWDDTLCLDSPGGSLSEGIKIARYLVFNSIGTRLEADVRCYSACAIIFMSGSSTIDVFVSPRRSMHVAADLGFHAPYLLMPNGVYDRQAVELAYGGAVSQMAELMNIGTHPYAPGEGSISVRLFLEMLKRGPYELFMIDTPGRALEYEIELFGSPTPLWNRDTLCQACINHYNGYVDRNICNRDPITIREENSFIDVAFYGVGAEGSLYCGLRIYHSGANARIAWIIKNPLFADELTLNEDDLVPISPELALDQIGSNDR